MEYPRTGADSGQRAVSLWRIVAWTAASIVLVGALLPTYLSRPTGSEGAAAVIVAAVLGIIPYCVYVALRKRSNPDRTILSPWLLVTTAAVAVFVNVGYEQRENEATDKTAVERGVASDVDSVTPVQRCVTKALEDIETASPERRAVLPDNPDAVIRQFCENAAETGDLSAGGDIFGSDELTVMTCTQGVMIQFNKVAPTERAFTAAAFRRFGETYCTELVRLDLIENPPSHARLEKIQDRVLRKMEQSGEISRIR